MRGFFDDITGTICRFRRCLRKIENGIKSNRRKTARYSVAGPESRREADDQAERSHAGGGTDPEPPLPEVHQDKPGSEADGPLAPTRRLQGLWKLKDKVGLITGGDSGIGRLVAARFRGNRKNAVFYRTSNF